ncbi:MAG: hypothetical protein KAH06_09795 [Desulfobacterales bacterium]|nr:hypothetical protein [Desulfobacterales bacterium]
MEIHLFLKNHCIQTGAKKEYERLLSSYFGNTCSENEKSVIEAKIDVLKFFLENADFPFIRGNYQELCGTCELPVRLVVPEDYSKMKIKYDDKEIKPEWKLSHE